MSAALLLHRADGAPDPTSFRRAAFGVDDPFAPGREIAWQDATALCAGRVHFEGEIEIAQHPHTETLVVVEGELGLRVPGAAPLVLGRGQGAVIGRGTALRLQAVSPVRWVGCATAGGAHAPGLVPLRADADFRPSSPPPAEVLLGPAPQCRSHNAFTDEGSACRIGTWDSTPYHRVVRPHRVHEFMFLLSGSVHFASPAGSVLSAGAGDALFVPQGTPVGWESRTHVAKFYLVQDGQA